MPKQKTYLNQDWQHQEFLQMLVKQLEPRFYNMTTGLIQEQYEEVFEVVFILNGSVGVGYKLMGDDFYAT